MNFKKHQGIILIFVFLSSYSEMLQSKSKIILIYRGFLNDLTFLIIFKSGILIGDKSNY